MAENRFLLKYKTKTDSELEDIISDKKTYVELARIAAIDILKGRNGKTELTEKAEFEIQTVKKKNEEEVEKNNFLTEDLNAPRLHSKRVVTLFSAIFSIIFGAVLMMYNFNQLGKIKARNLVFTFGIIYTIGTILLINLLSFPGNFVIIINLIGAYIMTEYFWNEHLGKEIKYRKRSWVKPAIISTIITIPFVLALIYR